MKRWLAIVALLCACAGAQTYAPILQPHVSFTDNSGNPCALCSLATYQAGTTTPLATFTDCTSGTQNQNPVPLDASGSAPICLSVGLAYKFVLLSASGGTLWTVDNIYGGIYPANTFLLLTGGTLTGPLNGTTATFSGAVTGSVFNGAGTGLTGTAAGLSIGGTAVSLAGGALGSLPYQSGADTTAFVASPTTSGHTFIPVWQPSGSPVALSSLDLATYLASPPAIGGTAAAPGSFTTLAVAGGTAMTANQGDGTSVQHSTGTTTSGNLVKYDATGNVVDSGIPATALTLKVVGTTGVFTTCVMVGHSSTDVSCSGTQAWLQTISGTYYPICFNYTPGIDWSATADVDGITRFVMGATALTGSSVAYYESSLQGGAAGATTQAYCLAFQ